MTVDVKNAQATEGTRGSDMVAEGMMEVMAVNPESHCRTLRWKYHPTARLRNTVMHGGHRGRERIPRNFGPPTDDESFRYEFCSTDWHLKYPWDSRLIKGRHHGGLIYFGGSYKHCQHHLADH